MKELLFVHIPKTGGTSILKKINQSMWKRSVYAGHDPLFILEKNNNINQSFSFCVVRNPYRRTFSYYNHFKKLNNIDCSFLEFLNKIKNKEHFKKTPMIVFPQSFYVYNSIGIIGVHKIYKYEKFYELEKDLNVEFEVLNKGSYTKKDYEKEYADEKIINLVRDLFYVDFINFNYSLDSYE